MKKVRIVLSFLFLLFTSVSTYAQNDGRTTNTKIADLLAQLPAKDGESLQTAMREMEGLGEAGLVQLISGFSPSEKVDNSTLEYAISGFTGYVTETGKENLRKTTVKALCTGMSNLKNPKNISFLISQLEILGKDDAVTCLQSYLGKEHFNHHAANALAAIGTEAAGAALLQALSNSTNIPVIQALGYMKYKKAVPQITEILATNNKEVNKAALYALANIGDAASENVLWQQALQTSFGYDNDYAATAYLNFISLLHKNGETELAKKSADKFFKSTRNSNVFAKIAALNLLTEIQKEGAVKQLATAAGDNNIEYRMAALQLASPYLSGENFNLFVKKLKKAKPEVQVDILRFLGNGKVEDALKAVSKYAGSKNQDVRLAAVAAMGQIGGASVPQKLFAVLKKGNEADARAVKQSLLLLDNSELGNLIEAELPKVDGKSKAVLIDVLAARRASSGFGTVAGLISSDNEEVQEAALNALPMLANEESLPKLFDLLMSSGTQKETAAIQKAIIAALDNMNTANEKSALVIERMNQGKEDKKELFYPLLSGIGGENALQIIQNAYQNGKGNARQKAIEALTKWPDASAMEALYSVASESKNAGEKDAALMAYVSLIKKDKVPQEQKLLLLKKAMEVAQTTKQKNQIIAEAGNITTFPAFVFAARYLDDAALKQTAAGAVMNIGLSDKSFHGTIVREYLTKAMKALEGPDAVYMQKSIQKFLDEMPQKEGFVVLFNGKDLSGWKGLVANPIKRARMDEKTLKEAQQKADEQMRESWVITEKGELLFTGKGDNIATVKNYGDIEMFIDWKIYDDGHKEGDAGIYLRGTPQVQIWDTSRVNVGAQVGSGGLYNNQKHESKPLKVADNKLGEWNHFYIKMIGDKVTVYLNGELVTDNVPLENYWNRKMPLFPEEQIELQAHGSRIGYRDIYIKELPRTEPFELTEEEKAEGFKVLFDGTDLDEWTGNTVDYVVEDGILAVRPQPGSRGNLFTKEEYGDFVFRFDFKLTPGANNGLGIRAPLTGDAAYQGMEIQILDNEADIYKDLEEYQYHGSVYGVIAAKRGYLKPVGEWNHQEVIVKGPKIKVILNGTTILDGDLTEARKKGTLDNKKHPGISRDKGHIGFLGHGSEVFFRNIRIKEL